MFFCDRPLNSGWLSGLLQFRGIVELDYREQVKILGFQNCREGALLVFADLACCLNIKI
jgi:hypothetical protein